MKRFISILLAVTLIGSMTGCECKHEKWNKADCVNPKTCDNCGATEGKALGHKWKEATCQEVKTCEICGEKEGGLAEHKWNTATCEEPKTCSICGKTEGTANDHKWQEATCEKPKTCSVCGKTEGNSIGHIWEEATYEKPSTCSVCGITVGEPKNSDYFSFEENISEFPELLTKGKYSEIYDSVQNHLKKEYIKDNDKAYEILELLDEIMPLLDDIDIEYDEIEKECKINYKSVKEISYDIHIVPAMTISSHKYDFNSYTSINCSVDTEIGFIRNGWLFFDKIIITGKNDDISVTSIKSYDKIQDVLGGSSVKESIIRSWNGWEEVIDADSPIIRFENEKDNKKDDYQVSKDEISAIKTIITIKEKTNKLNNLYYSCFK